MSAQLNRESSYSEGLAVIIPAYNVEEYIEETLCSVLECRNVKQVICINDGSMDNTMRVIESVKDERLVVISRENRGVSATRNEALDYVSCQYVSFVDGDDRYDSDKFNGAISKLFKENLDVLFFEVDTFSSSTSPVDNFYRVDLTQEILTGQQIFRELLKNKQEVGSVCRAFYSTAFLRNNKLRFVEDIPIGEDTLFVRQVLLAGEKISYIPEAVYQRRYRASSCIESSTREKIFISRMKMYFEFSKELERYCHNVYAKKCIRLRLRKDEGILKRSVILLTPECFEKAMERAKRYENSTTVVRKLSFAYKHKQLLISLVFLRNKAITILRSTTNIKG